MKKKILYLREMGSDVCTTDVINCRVRVLENIPIHYNGEDYNLFFEFLRCTHWHYRTENIRTGKPLKKPVYVLDVKEGLSLDTQFERMEKLSNGREWEMSYRLGKFEEEVYQERRAYTKKDILAVVNRYIIGDPYTDICFVKAAAKNIIKKVGGWRELDILGENKDFQTEGTSYFEVGETWNDEHKIMRCVKEVWEDCAPEYVAGAWRKVRRLVRAGSCEVDLITGTITG